MICHRFRFAGACLLLLLTTAAFSQKKIATRDLRDDLSFLQEALYRGHPGTFLFNSRDSLDVFFKQMRDRLKGDSVPIEQAQVAIRIAVARIHDGHTSVETPFFNDKTQVLPLTTDVVGEHVYIHGNYSTDSTITAGQELLAVNDEPAAVVVRIGHLLSTGDGFNKTFSSAIAPYLFARYYTLLFGLHPVNRVRVVGSDGKPGEHRIASLSRAKMLALILAKRPSKNKKQPVFKFKTMELWRDTLHADLAVLKLGGFPNGHFKRFYRRAFKWVADNRISNLVVDLRDNAGGNIYSMDYLVSQIVDQPFGYQYEQKKKLRMGRYFNLKAKINKGLSWMRYNISFRFGHRTEGGLRVHTIRFDPSRRNNFNGKVWVFTNGWSFSSASMCASFLKNKAGARVIGVETGGSETGNCGGTFPHLVLPNTRFKIRFPLYHLRYDVGKPDIGHGVQPDYPIVRQASDFLGNRDLEMERLYELLK
jgi:hypothetical protein